MKCPYIKLLWNPSDLLRFCLPFFTDTIFRGGTAYPSRTHGFTPLQCLMESVLLIFLLVLDLFTNVICVSWFHPLPSFRWGSGVDHQCCLCPLGSPPVFFCNIFFVVHFVSIFTFLVPCCQVSFDFHMKSMFGWYLSSTAGQTIFTYFWWFVYVCV
jgi:hypothetical protein